jgi:tyrosinase
VARFRSGDVVATIPLERIEPDFSRAELRLEGYRAPARSFELRFFADEPQANARTPTRGNPRYLGSQYIYGAGAYGAGAAEEPSPGGTVDAFRLDDVDRTPLRLNVTDGLRRYLTQTTPHEAPVTAVSVDRHGDELEDPGLDFEGVSVVTT